MEKAICEGKGCTTEIEVQMCCSGADCGCLGQPTEPPYCQECFMKRYDEFISKPITNTNHKIVNTRIHKDELQ